MKYNKPFKSTQQQVELLRERGLSIDGDAEHYLRHLNYYRLAGYWLPFEENHENHKFKPNSTFEEVLNLYIFDRELRLLLMDGIERIEVSVRTHWAYFLAETRGAHAYLDPNLSRKTEWYCKNFSLLDKELNRSDESFISHYKNKYKDPSQPPIWAVCEVMSLGLLSRWLKALKPNEVRTKISKSYQIDYEVLESFVEHLTYLRNLCAHHNRVWNRKMTKTMKLPRTKPKEIVHSFNAADSRKIYNSLVMMMHFLNIVSPQHHTKTRLSELIEKHSIDVTLMGFPITWQQLDIWK